MSLPHYAIVTRMLLLGYANCSSGFSGAAISFEFRVQIGLDRTSLLRNLVGSPTLSNV